MRGISFIIVLCCLLVPAISKAQNDSSFISFTADPELNKIEFFLKSPAGVIYNNFQALENTLEKNNRKLLFAMNGGMYHPNYRPVGLYIEDGEILVPKDTGNGKGNFYLKPNGIFYITKEKQAKVEETSKVTDLLKIQYATQSGPMLLIDGKIHPGFKDGSKNLQVRNGVGVDKDGKVVFAISKIPVSLFDFAMYFKKKGCLNALYLDGFVSRIYWPHRGYSNPSADFGVIIGVVE